MTKRFLRISLCAYCFSDPNGPVNSLSTLRMCPSDVTTSRASVGKTFICRKMLSVDKFMFPMCSTARHWLRLPMQMLRKVFYCEIGRNDSKPPAPDNAEDTRKEGLRSVADNNRSDLANGEDVGPRAGRLSLAGLVINQLSFDEPRSCSCTLSEAWTTAGFLLAIVRPS